MNVYWDGSKRKTQSEGLEWINKSGSLCNRENPSNKSNQIERRKISFDTL
jgi:hypothetical protein